MSAARCIALAAACPLVARASGAQSTVEFETQSGAQPTLLVVEFETQLEKCNYTYLHDGHCADGWIRGSNTRERSLDACSRRCFENQECGFFAYDNGTSGHTCSIYTESGLCPDDNSHPSWTAYRVRRAEWVLHAKNAVCDVSGFNPFISLPASADLGRCQAAALNDARCGPLVLSNAPDGFHGVVFTCGCLRASESSSFECVLEPSSSRSSTYTRHPSNYTFLHDGHCAAGWIQPNTVEGSLAACAGRCLDHQECGFFAIDATAPTADMGHTCALYSRDGRCSDDDLFPSYNAYRINRGEWVLKNTSMFCSNPADDLIDLGEGKTLEQCLAAALKHSLCGPLAITSAPRSPATCECLRPGRQCELSPGDAGRDVFAFEATAGA